MKWVLAVCVLLSTGCGGRDSSDIGGAAGSGGSGGTSGAAEVFYSLSTWFASIGGAALGLGIAALIAGVFLSLPPKVKHLAGALAATGLGLIAAAVGLRWAGDNIVVVLLVGGVGLVAGLAAYLWLYKRGMLEKAFRRDLDGDGRIGSDRIPSDVHRRVEGTYRPLHDKSVGKTPLEPK